MSKTPSGAPAPAELPAAERQRRLRSIPSVEKLLTSAPFAPLIAQWGRDEVKRELLAELEGFRRDPDTITDEPERIAALVVRRLEEAFAPSLRPVLNATGILIHTNLGRSPIHAEILGHASRALSGYANLELDLTTGRRGKRDEHLSLLASRLFGCEAALLVNNNASAVLLLLAAIAKEKEVIVSRGELVEIGGSFRVPEVIVQGGARLREVGTTNRTRAADYRDAVTESTAAMLRVHRSNFDIVGFTETPSIGEMVAVARETRLPLLYDEGSGRVVDLARYGLSGQPTVRDLLTAGVDAITCSTDKLIGASQGGLILGSRQIVDRCGSHPLMRALRAGKESYAIVSETFQAFLTGKQEELIPIYRMAATGTATLRERATELSARTGGAVVETKAAFGGGTTPTETMPSIGLAWPHGESLRAALLAQDPPILGRIEEDRLLLDLRSVPPEDDPLLEKGIQGALASIGEKPG